MHFSYSLIYLTIFDISCGRRNKRVLLTAKKTVTFRICFVVMSLRLFLDDDSNSDEKEEKEEKKYNKEKNFHTMNTTFVVSWWLSNGKTNIVQASRSSSWFERIDRFYTPYRTPLYYCLTCKYSIFLYYKFWFILLFCYMLFCLRFC